MQEIHRIQIPAAGAKALVWVGDALIDASAGRRSIPTDGSAGSNRRGVYGPQFDAATISPRGDLVALTATAGTKGLLLGPGGDLVREVDRSYYCAHIYRYPLALCTLPDGRTGIVHCPRDYNRLDIDDDAITGERLTDGHREPDDIFHSRLAVSASGRYLLSAGWVWHPWDVVVVFDLHAALATPSELDSAFGPFELGNLSNTEISGACFVGDDLIVSTSDEENDDPGDDELDATMLARRDLVARKFLWRKKLDHIAGDLIPIAGNFLSLHQFPRLYDATDGELLAEWPDLPTGSAATSIVRSDTFSGPARIAVDDAGRRFAHTDGEQVTVIELG